MRSLTRIAGVVIVAVLLPYAVPPVYDYSDPQPFDGAHWWNPYQEVHGRWRRANFHAHGESWGGVTNGAQTDAQVVTAYWNAGYDIATVSDYQRISDAADTIPVYERNNVGKHHQLAIGARSVVWWDFPFWQGINQKQFIIDRLRPSTELISLNHLSRLHSYTVDDMRSLTGYDLIEIANGRIATEDRWDAALSSGHPAFVIGGDDTHDVTDPNRMAIAWNMIDAETTSAHDVIEALRAGRWYVVIRMVDAAANSDVALAGMRADDRSVTVTLTGAPAEISFIGQDGTVRQRTNGLSASYSFTPSDTYIRTNVHTTKSIVFLNPVMRSDTDSHRPAMPEVETDDLLTPLVRAGVVASCGLVVWLMVWPRRQAGGPGRST